MMMVPSTPAEAQSVKVEASPGQLTIMDRNGKPTNLCPLKGTSVHANLSGLGARVVVTQTFSNPSDATIEAIYTFPLPEDAAVDRMRMKVGSRVIEGRIERREDARRIYDAAKAAGQTSSLLDQERPNIFTQSVANITPNAEIQVEISYVQLLKYEAGELEFTYPMVVGPRFTANAPDPDKIVPPIVPKSMRSGATINLNVSVEAGAPIREIQSVLHEVKTSNHDGKAQVILRKKDEIPNRDFVLRYRLAGDAVQTSFVSHMDPQNAGFFSLVVMPPKTPRADQIAPKEVIFVVDQSGSQSGFPIEKSRELTLKMISTLKPGDTFNVLGFSSQVNWLWTAPRPSTSENQADARKFVERLQANGGTQLRLAAEAALKAPPDPSRLRIVLFNTDGFIGDEKAVIESIRLYRERARMFTFGIGNSVNRYLVSAMSLEGRGDSEIVMLNASADAAVERFLKRTESPVLTNIEVRLESNGASEIIPNPLPDVFADKPIIVYGRYDQAGPAKITLTGDLGGKPWSQTIGVTFGASANAPAVQTLWARRKLDDIERDLYYGRFDGQAMRNEADVVAEHAMKFGIMSQHTSFVAVESKVVNIGGRQRTVRVPIEMADGVAYPTEKDLARTRSNAPRRPSVDMATLSSGTKGSVGGGLGGGGFGGVREPKEFDEALSPAESNVESKIAATLLKSKGKLEIQIWVAKVDATALKTLRNAGMKIAQTDRGLKIVFGECDASKLKAIAKIEFVQKIAPL
jgi:Ca-activated chloride channel family protein